MPAGRKEAANLVRRFLNGDVEPWELDDFISSPSDDPVVEKYRIEIARIPDVYPSTDNSYFASSEGLQRMQAILEDLEAEEGRDSNEL